MVSLDARDQDRIAVDKVALALSDPIRLKILDLLAMGRCDDCCSPENPDVPLGMCSCDLLPTLDLAPSRLSYHLKELREAELITEQKRGRWVYFSLNRPTVERFMESLRDRFVTEREPSCSAAPSCSEAPGRSGAPNCSDSPTCSGPPSTSDEHGSEGCGGEPAQACGSATTASSQTCGSPVSPRGHSATSCGQTRARGLEYAIPRPFVE